MIARFSEDVDIALSREFLGFSGELYGKSKEAVEVNAKIDKLLLAINSAYESLVERKTDFDAKAIKDLFQRCV